jgi:hypothetical protein
MLVGPRGTGKSFMGVQAVRKASSDKSLGVVQVVEIQGDPNKPPSDYFDDSISFSESAGRLAPSMINAPFFRLATREKGTNAFECHPGPENRIKLQMGGEEVDRLVIYWDEGNRSSPAMLNAMLGLLAEGRLRRDGIAYTFPPVSCILTRNPDGYDANSAKMPSPLIDRFGVQYYVYNPSMYTFVAVIAPAFLRRQRIALLRECLGAFRRIPNELDIVRCLQEVIASGERPDDPAPDQNVVEEIGKLGEVIYKTNLREVASNLNNKKTAANDATIREAVARATAQVKAKSKPFDPKSSLEADKALVAAEAVTKAATSELESAERAHFAISTWNRVLRLPSNSYEYRRAAARLAVVVVVTWGDDRDVEKKPGMQYLPPSTRDILRKLAADDPSVRSHLEEVGELTRYGTSIRAFEEMLKALFSLIVDDSAAGELQRLENALKELRKRQLGALLGHRCETTFNPDREPSKALRKSRSLLWLAKWVLDDSRHKEIVELTKLDKQLADSKTLSE